MRDSPILHGERFTLEVDLDPDAVFAYLLDVTRTPEWRTHLHTVEWVDDGVMQGAVPLDSAYLRVVGPLLKRATDRTTRGEMRRLEAILGRP